MDFAEFAEQYKRRTAKRMLDFEAAVAEAHRQMEQVNRQQAIARELNLRVEPTTPRGVYRPTRRGGRVQGVLRRGEPGD
ncbi:hypothetical protein [Corynebacterium liangguodongii]|uniref:Uncharacterized protein n=1 Tax=Corynebacterium liangguodongii TaxID=2079535 RepID=A0A2S0WH36_9CORY|nr:hypothetical protein [Corynebacterium liangguodongii]AWB84992.1 hypothetical protein C3E79_02015 [Corynebacterium liangguodongii]PWC00495.1 hypothetical protein DF219_00935 [Corynebacterium liangguodongii]